MYTVDFISEADAKILFYKIKKLFDLNLTNFSMPIFRRRSHKFFIEHNISSLTEFISLIERDHRFFEIYANSVSITETSMFRDVDFWKFIESDILVNLLSKKDRIKIWLPDSVGGAEYRTIAIILKETGYIEKTDILVSAYSEYLLKSIEEGVYNQRQAETDKENYIRFKNYDADYSVYYQTVNGRTNTNPVLQKNTFFAKIDFQHDLLPEEIDLIIYRNKFLSFDESLKDQIKNLLAKSLVKDGFLAIGVKEQINTKNSNLALYNNSERIYIKQK